jgi:hypothetical protein
MNETQYLLNDAVRIIEMLKGVEGDEKNPGGTELWEIAGAIGVESGRMDRVADALRGARRQAATKSVAMTMGPGMFLARGTGAGLTKPIVARLIMGLLGIVVVAALMTYANQQPKNRAIVWLLGGIPPCVFIAWTMIRAVVTAMTRSYLVGLPGKVLMGLRGPLGAVSAWAVPLADVRLAVQEQVGMTKAEGIDLAPVLGLSFTGGKGKSVLLFAGLPGDELSTVIAAFEAWRKAEKESVGVFAV